MDDYKRELLMRVRDRLMDPNRYHTGLCDCSADELEIDGAVIDDTELFLVDLQNEMLQLFDYSMWHRELYAGDIVDSSHLVEANDYWWYPPCWVEPRIAMLDFLLNNR